jgi:hypothetical protein
VGVVERAVLSKVYSVDAWSDDERGHSAFEYFKVIKAL